MSTNTIRFLISLVVILLIVGFATRAHEAARSLEGLAIMAADRI
jgi:Sec-independent protein translocase protein TatA